MLESILLMVLALGALASVGVFVRSSMKRNERRERVLDIIAGRRKSLYEDTRAEMAGKGKKQTEDKSAAESVGIFFKVEKLAGDMARKWRNMLSQAGYRQPMAIIVFLGLRIVLPLIFCTLAMVFMGAAKEPLPNSVALMILGGAALAGFFLPRILVKNQAMKRQKELNLAFPDALDLMLICVQGGISIEPTIDRVAKEMLESSPVLGEEMGLLGAELGLLSNRKEAFQNFSSRVMGGSVRVFANAMIQAEQYGTGVSKALRVLSDDLRDQRMAEAERKAASLPPKLTVPMILFFLPALFVVILGPAVIQAIAARAGAG